MNLLKDGRMNRLSTDLIGRVFNDNHVSYLVTDRKAKQNGHAVVRKVHSGMSLIEMPMHDVTRLVQKEY